MKQKFKELTNLPDMKEVKEVVFNIKGENACGPDGMSSIFYQYCWEIVWPDVVELVKDFFEENTLPKVITHTNLINSAP